MKNISFIILLLILLNSCVSPNYNYYQVYSAKYDNLKKNEDFLEYENEFYSIKYNLWSNGGNPSFLIYNKSDKNLVINLEDSYFIKNGIAYNYFKNRTYTQSKTIGITTNNWMNGSTYVSPNNSLVAINSNSTNTLGTSSNQGYSVSYIEEKYITIPPKSAKYFNE